MMRRAAIAALVIGISAGAAGAGWPGEPKPLAPTASARVAMVLAQGLAHPDAAARAAAVEQLAELGARPADAGVADYQAEWRTSARRSAPRAPAYRGRLLGPIYRHGAVNGGQSAMIEQLFVGGQPASLALAPVRGARLGLVVRDMQGQAVCDTPARRPVTSCNWLPAYSARYRIEIRNPGLQPIEYVVAMD